MEWNRGGRPNQPSGTPAGHPVSATPTGNVKNISKGLSLRTALTAGGAVLVALLVFFIVNNAGGLARGGEAGNVDGKKMQAVFLNGGQVYFGKIDDLNSDYMKVKDIYYLRVNQQVQPNQANTQNASNDISLVKLGCELHGPQDSMVINREHVIFWENLKDDGQVAKAVAEYKKQNPDGQKCDTEAGAGGSTQSTPTNAAPATGTGTGTGAGSTPATGTGTGTNR